MKRWRRIRCNCIAGIDPMAYGSITGEAPVECQDCADGYLYVVPSDHVFAWIGGPARGKWPGAFAKAMTIPAAERTP